MNEQLDAATRAATWFEAFIQNASAVSILLALAGSWAIALWLRFPFRQMIPKVWIAWSVYTVEVVAAFGICYGTWPNPEPLAWAITVGGASPLLFLAFALLLAWKFPALKPYLFLSQIAAANAPETGDETRVPPTDTQ